MLRYKFTQTPCRYFFSLIKDTESVKINDVFKIDFIALTETKMIQL